MQKKEAVTVKGRTVMIDSRVRLTPGQKLVLIAASNSGGRVGVEGRLEFSDRETLKHLKLIEERSISREEANKIKERIANKWAMVRAALHEKNTALLPDTYKLKNDIEALDAKVLWLTSAAREYLSTGTVLIEQVGN